MKKEVVWTLALVALMTGCVSTKTARTTSDAGLLAYYPLDGNARDASGHGYDGLAVSVTFEKGYIGQAARFIGTYDSFIKIDRFPNVKSNVTVSAWIRPASGGYGAIFCRGRTKCAYDLAVSDDHLLTWLNFGMPGSGPRDIQIPDLPANRFYHVAMVCDAAHGQLLYYVDGERKAKFNYSDSFNFEAQAEPLYLGIDPPGAPECYSGLIDEVRIYNRPLTDDEVRMQASEPPK